MRHYDRRGRLFGIELILLGEAHPDRFRLKERQELALVGEVGTGGIAEGIAAAAIGLAQHLLDVARFLAGKTEFGTDALMDEFVHYFGRLHRETVEIEVILIAVLREPSA